MINGGLQKVEFISFIEKAKENGWKKQQLIRYLNEYWKDVNVKVELPEESEEQKEFRKKVQYFFDLHYAEFEKYASQDDTCLLMYSNWYKWEKIKPIEHTVRKELVCEIAGSIYKGFEMEHADKTQIKKKTIERTRAIFPSITTHSLLFDVVFSRLLGYSRNVVKGNEECKEFLNKFELKSPCDKLVCKFIWLIENFQP